MLAARFSHRTYLLPLRYAAAAVLLTVAGGAAPLPASSAKPLRRVAIPTTQPVDMAFERRVERFEGLISPPHPASFMSEYLDVQPGQAAGLSRPLPVFHIVYGEGVIFLASGSALAPRSSSLLDLWAKELKQDVAGAKLTLVVHTDARGSDKADDEVSLQRARNVIQALVHRGTDLAALSAVVIGKRQPIATNDTESGRTRNRRIEFLVSTNLDANLAVVRLHPIDRGFLAGAGAHAAVKSDTRVQVMRADRAAAGQIVMRSAGTVALQEPSDNPGPSPIPRQPILREGASNWPDPPELPDSPAPNSR